jgi:hypothetical protein
LEEVAIRGLKMAERLLQRDAGNLVQPSVLDFLFPLGQERRILQIGDILLALVPRILPIAQGAIVDIPHAAERPIQVHDLIRRRVEAVSIGAKRHLQILVCAVNTVKWRLNATKEAVLADGPLSLPGLNAGVSRGEMEWTPPTP